MIIIDGNLYTNGNSYTTVNKNGRIDYMSTITGTTSGVTYPKEIFIKELKKLKNKLKREQRKKKLKRIIEEI